MTWNKLYKAAPQPAGVEYPVMAAIRDDVCRPQTVTALSTLRAALLANGSPKALRLARLTNLRLRDVAAWQHWKLVGDPPPPPVWPARVPW